MKTFFNSISLIKQGIKPGKDIEQNININNENSNISMDNEVDKILLDSKKEEDIIFYHYGKNNLIKLNYEEKSVATMPFLEYDINAEDEKLELDEKEIENIKTFHVLHVLKPKIEIYLSYKNIEFNCLFMSNIYSYAEEIGFENTIGYLLPLIQDLIYQKDKSTNILISFLNSFEKLLIYFKQFDKDHSIILNKLFPILSEILTSKRETNLLNKTVNSLKFLIDNITIEECLNNIIPLLIRMANNEENEIGQMISIQIFSNKASILGGENIEVYILPMFESFSENINEKLRTYCIQYMIPLFENINYDIIQTKFVKIYRNFSRDKSIIIRKLSCNLLPSVCKTILNNNNNYNQEASIKKEELISKNILDIFKSFTNDVDMQCNAISIFGEFLPYLNEEILIKNENLLYFYIEKLNKLFKNKYVDSKTIYEACYSFPSVLLSYYSKISDEQIKNKNWDLLKSIYYEFVKSKEFRIKNSIAASFGVIASILDEKIFEKEITPLISKMFYNNNNKIKNTIIFGLPKVLVHMKEMKLRLELLEIYKIGFNTIKFYKTWRDKINYVKGIKKMKDLFDIDIIFKDLVKMLIEMCFDTFNIIRIKAAKTLSIFLLQFLFLEDENSYKKNAINILNDFGKSKHFHYRQLFVYLCKKLFTNKEVFEKYGYDLLNNLSYDKVPNTRYTLSKFLNIIWNKNKNEYDWIKNDEKIIEIIYRLKNDKENEVKKCVENIEINVDKIDVNKTMEKMNVNEKFVKHFKDFKNIFEFEPFLGKSWIKSK
jgi:hypothetical protein